MQRDKVIEIVAKIIALIIVILMIILPAINEENEPEAVFQANVASLTAVTVPVKVPAPTPTVILTPTPTSEPTPTPTLIPTPTVTPTPEPTPTPIVEDGYLSVTEDEKKMILKIAQAEARDQGVKGKALVMNVVFRRRYLKQFPNSIEGVIFEPAQFSPINDGNYAKAVPDEECYEALEKVLNGYDESQGATYFRTVTDEDCWHKRTLQWLFDYKGHSFFKEKEKDK